MLSHTNPYHTSFHRR